MQVSLDFEWRAIGDVRLEVGKLVFPVAPETPGVYCFDFDDRLYIGETDRLRRRFQHYRTPGPSQATNVRLNALMRELLGAEKSAAVLIATSARVEVDGASRALDLSEKPARLLVENAALVQARLAGTAVVNL